MTDNCVYGNLTPGLLIKIEKGSGELRIQNYLGRSAFRFVTHFRKIHLLANQINLTEDSEYKWLINFDKTESTQWLINKNRLVNITAVCWKFERPWLSKTKTDIIALRMEFIQRKRFYFIIT